MKKKLIIHNGNISIGGQEKMLIEFLNILDPTKYEVLLLIEENKGKNNDYIDEIPKWINYKFLTSEKLMENINTLKNKKNIFAKLYYSILLKKKKNVAIKEFEKNLDFSDIIIDYDMGLLRNLHKLSLKNKTIIGWSHAGEGTPPKNKQKRKNIEKYNYIMTINDVMKKGYEKNLKDPKILKINNFMNFDKILEKSNEKVEEYGEYIISVGSLTENKNHILLIEAFGELKKEKNIKEKLIIIGDGKEKEKLKERIDGLNLNEDILLLGQKQNPYKYMKNSKLYVSVSKNEGLPLTSIEAMILQKMIIAVENNGTRELLDKNSIYGKLIKNNKEELKEKLYYYLINNQERKKYEIKGFERAKNYDKNIVKIEIERFIDKL
ncbi:glycosyltransferase [uncultured Fusobacterium sp.]|uniref:glycosyltransferase n=1 Tax=uncultured Fusobacterium sp. TaxID=159267 RepID=UPI0025D37264|nr:glycosyltransferase [uncultured Fusobacterium sp.]